MKIDPLRVELTVPEQYLSRVNERPGGAPDAWTPIPARRFAAKVRFVSPALKTDQRALTVEADRAERRRPAEAGLFATALLQEPAPAPALLVPASAVETVAGTSRVFVVAGDKVEERIVTIGEHVGDRIELATGVKAGETVAANPRGKLTDGTRVQLEN